MTKLDTVFKRARVAAARAFTAPVTPVDDALTALDPEEACQQAIAGIVVHRADPLNCETPFPR
jgi:hypothetical protein